MGKTCRWMHRDFCEAGFSVRLCGGLAGHGEEGRRQAGQAAFLQAVQVFDDLRRALQRQHAQLRAVRHLVTGDDADADVAQHRLADRLAAADLQQCLRAHAGIHEHPLGQFAGGGAGLAHQQAVAGQGGQRHAAQRRQRMLAVHRQHQWVAAQFQAHQARIVEALRGGGEVDAELVERLQHLLGVADLHRHLDAGQALAEALEQVEHVVGRGGAEAQAALLLAAVAQEELDVGFLLQQRAHPGQQLGAGIAEGQPAAAAVEQLDAVARLQLADLGGHRRLTEAELLRRLGDAAQLRHLVESLQFAAQRRRFRGLGVHFNASRTPLAAGERSDRATERPGAAEVAAGARGMEKKRGRSRAVKRCCRKLRETGSHPGRLRPADPCVGARGERQGQKKPSGLMS
ncbi:hypothetical protein OF001_U240002 [Pseudomonas sp. OF001]|nr:hypothetical protein OF001_U240002 [Pseudomonas sp. OF001]